MGLGKALQNFVAKRKKLVNDELARTKPLADYAAQDHGWSILVPFLETAKENGAIGADTALKANSKLHYYMNRADTAAGTILRGNSKPGNFRHWLFTKKKNSVVPLNNGKVDPYMKNPQDFRQIERASISSPIEGGLTILGTGLAANKIYSLRHPEEEVQGQNNIDSTLNYY